MTTLFVRVHTLLLAAVPAVRHRGDAGQTTAEYALVLLGVAAIALLVVAWATPVVNRGRAACATAPRPTRST